MFEGVGAELWLKSAVELAGEIRAGRVRSREVVEAHLARIDEVNGRVNAVTAVLADEALAAADEADEIVAAGGATGVFHGVPFTTKENIDVAGAATTAGVPAFADAVALSDSVLVERMRSAGAIPFARTNMPEMALRISTDNPLHGLTRNPWNLDLTAGGSSGGEAAALASGMSPIGFGNDFGASLRSPAYCCGVAALRPTSPGRVPKSLVDPPLVGQLMFTDGPMARSVEDLRVALGVVGGWDRRDPWSVPTPVKASVASRRAALVTQIEGARIDSQLVDAVREVGEVLQDAGYLIAEGEPPEWARIHELWARLSASFIASRMEEMRPIVSDALFSWFEQAVERYPSDQLSGIDVYAERSRLGRAWSEFFVEYPVVVSPVWTGSPFPHDADLDPESGLDLFFDLVRPSTVGNFLGIPSVAIPTGTQSGIPTGVQIYADRWCEEDCLDAARTVEEQLEPITPIDP